MRFILTFVLLLIHFGLSAQSPSTSSHVESAIEIRLKLLESSPFKHLPARSIGPVVTGSRITDVDVNETDPTEYFIAFASGGLWQTTNNGQSFESLFDHQGHLTIGDIAVHPNNRKDIWVGTGENNSSRSSYAGSGLYRSTDGGKNWTHLGLTETQHIGRILLHPENPEIAWVASIGPLYSKNTFGGVFKTTDGGKTWNKTLFVSDSTGVIDLTIKWDNPNVLIAAAWERDRKAWNFKEGGEESALYRSQDGGETWTKLSNGLPKGNIGRYGVEFSRSTTSVVYAVADNQNRQKAKETKEKTADGLTTDELKSMSKQQVLALADKELDAYLRRENFPTFYTAKTIKQGLVNTEFTVGDLAGYNQSNANDNLFQGDVIGPEVYRSDDAGLTWKKQNTELIESTYFTYGYYFGQMRVAPQDDKRIYIMGVPALTSANGGKTWTRFDTGGVHVDHHALWINPNNPKHLLLGNDGGVYTSYDHGEHWTHHNSIPAGQFYTVNVDMETPYNVYGGLQDNGVFFGSSKHEINSGTYWKRLMGGDGMHVAPNPKDPSIVYTGFQFGNYFRVDQKKGNRTRITPFRKIGRPELRFNWNSPVEVSRHNPDIVYFGSQFLHRSVDRGDTWETISGDLTRNLPFGDVPYSTLTQIDESPFQFGLIWVGSDDGKVHLTQDGGSTWTDASQGLPKNLWVAGVQASPHKKSAALIAMTGYRYDHFAPYLFYTEDFGKTWTSLNGNIPKEATNMVFQDWEDPNLLFAGTDSGTYVSLDFGKTWTYLSEDIPNVASYDLIVHPRDGELVVATHGRSMYVVDIKPLREINAHPNQNLIVFGDREIRHSNRWGNKFAFYAEAFEPKLTFSFFTRNAKADDIEIVIKDEEGQFVHHEKIKTQGGYDRWTFDLKGYEANKKKPKKVNEKDYLKPGKYSVTFSAGKESQTQQLHIKK